MKKTPYKTNQNNPLIKAYKEAVKRGQASHHVIYSENGWVVKRADSIRASQIFTTKKEATSYAYGVAHNQGTSLFVHGVDGKIIERRDF